MPYVNGRYRLDPASKLLAGALGVVVFIGSSWLVAHGLEGPLALLAWLFLGFPAALIAIFLFGRAVRRGEEEEDPGRLKRARMSAVAVIVVILGVGALLVVRG